MWVLDHKESWALNDWCFWTVVLEKILESPLDCKEIQPVHPKGDQSWVFFGWTDAEAPIFWPHDVKNWLIGKDPDAGKDWGQEEKGTTEDEMVGWHHRLHGHEFEQAPGVDDEQEAWRAAVHGVAKSQTRLSAWTELSPESRGRKCWDLLSFLISPCRASDSSNKNTQQRSKFPWCLTESEGRIFFLKHQRTEVQDLTSTRPYRNLASSQREGLGFAWLWGGGLSPPLVKLALHWPFLLNADFLGHFKGKLTGNNRWHEIVHSLWGLTTEHARSVASVMSDSRQPYGR